MENSPEWKRNDTGLMMVKEVEMKRENEVVRLGGKRNKKK